MGFGLAALLASACLLGAAGLLPLTTEEESMAVASRQAVPEMTLVTLAEEELLKAVAGRRLIRPAQVQAAVKDNGAAQRLLERLKLQSLVSLGGQSAAYVNVKGEGVQSVRAGGRLLDFQVESIDSSGLTLTLDGVQVKLTR